MRAISGGQHDRTREAERLRSSTYFFGSPCVTTGIELTNLMRESYDGDEELALCVMDARRSACAADCHTILAGARCSSCWSNRTRTRLQRRPIPLAQDLGLTTKLALPLTHLQRRPEVATLTDERRVPMTKVWDRWWKARG